MIFRFDIDMTAIFFPLLAFRSSPRAMDDAGPARRKALPRPAAFAGNSCPAGRAARTRAKKNPHTPRDFSMARALLVFVLQLDASPRG
jgi:hypothetical protein